jgi:hypothetical protein
VGYGYLVLKVKFFNVLYGIRGEGVLWHNKKLETSLKYTR